MDIIFVFTYSVGTLILGFMYKKRGLKTTKNIVVGIIFTFLLILFGSYTFIFGRLYSHDYTYANKIETQVHFDFPDMGNITTEDMGNQSGIDAETTQYLYMSDIVFTDKNEVFLFNSKVANSKLFMTSLSTLLLGEIPSMYTFLTSESDYNYFMIYNCDLNTYNTIPEKSGTYRYLFIAYNSLKGTMKVFEYTKVSVNSSTPYHYIYITL